MGNTKFSRGDKVIHSKSKETGTIVSTILTEFSDDYVSVKWDNYNGGWVAYVTHQDSIEKVK